MEKNPKVIDLGAMTPEQMLPGLTRRYASGEQTTVTLFEYTTGGVAPMHAHRHEQVSYVVRGRLKATVDGRTFELGPGQAVLVPPNVPHRFEALTDALEIDFFTPARDDWAAGDDRYLRILGST